MNWTLYKATFRANWVLALIFTLIIMIYVTTSAAMFDPDSVEAMDAMFSLLPEAMIKVFGFINLGTDLTTYISNYLYGFILIIFPMIYCIILANRLVAKHVDRGSMAYLLTTPNSRVRVASTQALYLVTSLAAVLIVVVAAAILMSELMFPGMLNVGSFLALNWLTYLGMLVVGGIGFLSSCLFNETRFSLAFGAGFPLLSLVSRMLSGLSEDIAWLEYLSVFSFLEIDKILADASYVLLPTLILLALAAVLYVTAVWIFDRKSLAL